ncbi:hypothetical protein JOD27_001674 [Lentzea nigeriaca]|nr:hypothetical protein [Lentzea nigeriaca]
MTRRPGRAESQARARCRPQRVPFVAEPSVSMAGPGCDQAEGLLLCGSARSPQAEIPLPRKELWP